MDGLSMRVQTDAGSFVISLDLAAPRPLEAAPSRVGDLVKLLSGLGLSATWFCPDPAVSKSLDRVLSVSPVQEVGLATDATWAGSSATRTVYHRELTRRLDRAAAAGLQVSSLSSDTESNHLDVAARLGVTALRLAPKSEPVSLVARSLRLLMTGAGVCGASPQPTRFGLWRVDASVRFPDRERFSLGGSVRSASRSLASAAAGGFFHLAIDVALLDQAGAAGIKALERVLSYSVQQEQLAIVNVREYVQRKLQERKPRPAQSILHRRAA